MRKFILTDVDDVILDWSNSFRQWLEDQYNIFSDVPLNHHYNIEKWLNIPKERAIRFVEEFQNDESWFSRLPPRDCAHIWINKLVSEGYQFLAITSCGNSSESVVNSRMYNLSRVYGDIFSDVIILGLHEDKRSQLKLMQPAVWVEDNVNNARVGAEEGHKAYLIDAPYHKDMHHDKVTKVPHWGYIYREIKNMEENVA